MNDYDCVNIFLSEGQALIILSKKKKNNQIINDAFGHIRLDELNLKWYASYFKKHLKADKVLCKKWIF